VGSAGEPRSRLSSWRRRPRSCWCWTSRRTTSTWRAWTGSSRRSARTGGPCSWSVTTSGFCPISTWTDGSRWTADAQTTGAGPGGPAPVLREGSAQCEAGLGVVVALGGRTDPEVLDDRDAGRSVLVHAADDALTPGDLVRFTGGVVRLVGQHALVVDAVEFGSGLDHVLAGDAAVHLGRGLQCGKQRVLPDPAGGVAVVGGVDVADGLAHLGVTVGLAAPRTPRRSLEVHRLQGRSGLGLQQGRVPRRARADHGALPALRRRATDDRGHLGRTGRDVQQVGLLL